MILDGTGTETFSLSGRPMQTATHEEEKEENKPELRSNVACPRMRLRFDVPRNSTTSSHALNSVTGRPEDSLYTLNYKMHKEEIPDCWPD